MACIDMPAKKWMSSNVCENDPIAPLKLLDAESHPNISEMALKTPIEMKVVKPMAYATASVIVFARIGKHADSAFPKKLKKKKKRKRTRDDERRALFAGRSVVLARHRRSARESKPRVQEEYALANGQAATVLQAETEEVEDALDQCLPESSMDLLRIISMHADGKTTASIFSARQLTMTLNCSDMNDGALRRGAANVRL